MPILGWMADQSKTRAGLNVSYQVSRQTAYEVAVERDHGRLTSNPEVISSAVWVSNDKTRISSVLDFLTRCRLRGTNFFCSGLSPVRWAQWLHPLYADLGGVGRGLQ